MIKAIDVYKIQSDFGIQDKEYKGAVTTFEDYLASCRSYITQNRSKEYDNLQHDVKVQEQKSLVFRFVQLHPVKVKGYLNPNNTINTTLLQEDLDDAVTGASILREALEDPEVDEIQINDMYTIFVSKGGLLVPYQDKYGRYPQFTSDEEIITILRKLIDNNTQNTPNIGDGSPLLNAKTAKDQYRVNMVHSSANTMDKPPRSFPITNVTLRKFKEQKLTVQDLVKGGSCTQEMGDLLLLLGEAQLKLFFVGPTGSGKTTALQIVANTIPLGKRIIMIQNPTEISFLERHTDGRNKRNVVHHEVQSVAKEAENDTSATFVNLISNALRETPDVMIIGESRTSAEFNQIFRALQTGQTVMGTFHAESGIDAIGRFSTELSMENGGNIEVYRTVISGLIDIVISQYRYKDGKRRIKEISEVDGVDEHGNPRVTVLYRFVPVDTVINEHGLEETKGYFKKENSISGKLADRFITAGVPVERIMNYISDEFKEELQERKRELIEMEKKGKVEAQVI